MPCGLGNTLVLWICDIGFMWEFCFSGFAMRAQSTTRWPAVRAGKSTSKVLIWNRLCNVTAARCKLPCSSITTDILAQDCGYCRKKKRGKNPLQSRLDLNIAHTGMNWNEWNILGRSINLYLTCIRLSRTTPSTFTLQQTAKGSLQLVRQTKLLKSQLWWAAVGEPWSEQWLKRKAFLNCGFS